MSYPGTQDQTYNVRLVGTNGVGNPFEQTTSVTLSSVTKYYHHGGSRVAMRQGDTVYYLHGDHLGSTSLTTDAAGSVVSEGRYLPFGGSRWADGIGVTDFTYTGQRAEGFQLQDYNARMYSSYLNRFVSGDSIVPDYSNPQSLNRYAYTLNNPLVFVDPTGHFTEDAIREYLQDRYSETEAAEMLERWKADTQWWGVVTTAQGGDHLFGGNTDGTDGFLLQFIGSGHETLTGFSYEYGYEGQSFVPNLEGRRLADNWLGLVQWSGDGEIPTFNLRGNPEITQLYTSGKAHTAFETAAFFWSITAGLMFPGVSLPAKVAVGFGAGVPATYGDNLLYDVANMELIDRQIYIDQAYFNLQLQPNGGWAIEKFVWKPNTSSHYFYRQGRYDGLFSNSHLY